MSAKAIYGVRVVLEIVRWEGEWDNHEARLAPESAQLLETENLDVARAFFEQTAKDA